MKYPVKTRNVVLLSVIGPSAAAIILMIGILIGNKSAPKAPKPEPPRAEVVVKRKDLGLEVSRWAGVANKIIRTRCRGCGLCAPDKLNGYFTDEEIARLQDKISLTVPTDFKIVLEQTNDKNMCGLVAHCHYVGNEMSGTHTGNPEEK